MEEAFADIHAMVVQTTTYSTPSQVPASWEVGVSLEAILSHLERPYSMAQAIERCAARTVRAAPTTRGAPGRPTRIHTMNVNFPVADPGCPGHYFAPGHYVHVDALFVETWNRLILSDGELTRLTITPSGAARSPTDGPPDQRSAARTPGATRHRSPSNKMPIGRNRSPSNKMPSGAARHRSPSNKMPTGSRDIKRRSGTPHPSVALAGQGIFRTAPPAGPVITSIGTAHSFAPIKGEYIWVRVPGRDGEY